MSGKQPTDYYLEGVTLPSTPRPGATPAPWGQTRVVGQRLPRVDGYERVSGAAVYPSDVVLPGMLHAAILRCPHPSARVRRLDAAQASKLPGVRAVLTPDSPEVKGLRWSWRRSRITSGVLVTECRYEGEPVAAVAADTPYQARDALRAIAVEYEVLPHLLDERRALSPKAPAVHPGGNRAGADRYQRGDVERGFKQADVVLERSYHTACELHTPLEPHGCVARWDGPRLTLWESTQGVFRIQQQVATVLGLPLSRVRVIGSYMGGGFGSKLRAGRYTVLAALLARRTGRPVKLFLSREETFLTTGNRPAARMTLKAGIKKDGTLTALQFSGLATGGAYPAGGAALLDWLVRDLYACENVRTETTDVFVNAGPARPFRAPGHPQGAWALEQMLDELARRIGMDPVELRLKNVPARSQAREGQPPYSTTGLARCLRRGAEAFGWQQARKQPAPAGDGGHLRRGVGMAACLWIAGAGRPPSTVVLKLFADGTLNLNLGASDIGTGTKTVMAMVAAEELGLRPELIQLEHADTGSTQFATPSGGSKTVPTEAPAVRDAAIQLKRKLLGWAAEALKLPARELVYRGQTIASRRRPQRSIAVRKLPQLQRRGVAVGVGHRHPNPKGKATCPFAAQFCEVEVDTRTGEVRLLRLVAAHESGRVLDRLTFDSQVIGGVAMGVGFGMTEQRLLDRKRTGKLVNRNWHDYKLPTALDVPERVEPLAVELPDAVANTTGAKGLGEPVTIPTAAAIANAVFDATGLRITETPITPARLCSLLAETRKQEG
jgi:xanthine dehydrogenase YagR molybdenum-binding subunit